LHKTAGPVTQRAKATPPPKTLTGGVGGAPADERNHFIECPTYGHMIDCWGRATATA
jgi:hypothetical protein